MLKKKLSQETLRVDGRSGVASLMNTLELPHRDVLERQLAISTLLKLNALPLGMTGEILDRSKTALFDV